MKEYLIIEDKPHCLIKFNEDVPCLMVKWRGKLNSDLYRQSMNTLLAQIQARGVSKILNDDRKITGSITKADQTWAAQEWLPQALALGYKAMAVVQTEDFFRKVPAAQVAAMARLYYQDQIKIEYFDQIKAASDWLAKV
jgi:hypothetical protein